MKAPIRLLAFGDVDDDLVERLARSLERGFSCPVAVGPTQQPPQTGFDPRRNQQLAGVFLEKLRDQNGSAKILGVTETDLYSSGLNFVFGQAEVDGRAAVISLARLRPNNTGGGDPLFFNRALKEAVHELGHTYGLDHCRDPLCVMHFSTGIAETDIKRETFCPRHAAEIDAGRRE